MNEPERRARAIFQAGNRAVALAVSACLLAFLGFGIGAAPALGPALVPGHGAWRSAVDATLPARQSLSLAGVASPDPYSDLTDASRPGAYLPLSAAGAAASSSAAINWNLRP
ncbi:MAG TPA: hypothetical protein VMA72_29655 [Streptosporangiaceae bacterium]|nr:hypothetical protein [Streptosporangiaceae bacterium]